MAQGVLPFQYEIEKSPSGMTALAGLLAYLRHSAYPLHKPVIYNNLLEWLFLTGGDYYGNTR